MDLRERLLQFIDYKGLDKASFERAADLSNGFVDKSGNNTRKKSLDKISIAFPELNIAWLRTGEGSMISDQVIYEETQTRDGRHLIPFFDDVATFGGTEVTADVETAYSYATEFIDAGDWFRDATAAIRHYGKSMVEYPSGCILALKEVRDRQLIIPGRDYTIETSEYRVTKRLQKGKTDEYVTAYSTNLETYPDGRMVHEPFDIPWSSIRRIYAVLGYVVKKNGGTFVFSNNGRR